MELTLPVASWHPNAVQPAEGRVLSYAPPEEDECVASYHPARQFRGRMGDNEPELMWTVHFEDDRVACHVTHRTPGSADLAGRAGAGGLRDTPTARLEGKAAARSRIKQ